ncbi:S66 peptidase family protein [Leptolyngbya iicbica]|uniref:LD-carboxypeptidase n=2 Tax=Cyanophyceae TaxID=3028117 RepID=A0A4Q7E679_9CYAN|nr:LD-carboxypeptidase [Leptolyngbya sp. LK]RZM77761.1 LD-carboxypeptidase [Leptolyngbya sp. LK]
MGRRPTRRQLIAGAGAIAATLPFATRASAQATTPRPLKPPRLHPGDTVGIISPAGATFNTTDLDIVMDAVRGLGLVPRPAPHVLAQYGYLAGKDRDRAADVNQFFADPAIKALLPIRGDWGCARILPYLDYDLIRQNPKIITGFSDLTALLLGITAQTGLVTFHGPNGLTAWRPDQTEPFRQVLFDGQALTFENPIAGEDRDRLMQTRFRVQTITPGQARGKLYGGNLSVISGIVGSPYVPDLTGAILFLEDVGESIYRIDRMLTQLKLAGVLDQLAGFVFGQCTNCGPSGGYGGLTLEQVLTDHIAPLGIPAWWNAAIGHVEPILTLPLGLTVTMDATAGQIAMTEGAIV